MQPSLLLLLLRAQVILYLSTIDKSLKGLSWKNICKKMVTAKGTLNRTQKVGMTLGNDLFCRKSPNLDCFDKTWREITFSSKNLLCYF